MSGTHTQARKSPAWRSSALPKRSRNPARAKARKAELRGRKLQSQLDAAATMARDQESRDSDAPPAVEVPQNTDFDSLLAATPVKLGRGDPKASARYASAQLLPHLVTLQHGTTFALYWLLAGVFHVVGLLNPLRRDESRVRAIRKALRFGSGATLYLQLLNGLAPPPGEDGTGARKAAQNRHSNYNRALLAAEAEGLTARELLERLVQDGGIEKLIEEARALGAEDAHGGSGDEQGGDSDGESEVFVKRSERRKEVRKQQLDKEDDGWSTPAAGGSAKRGAGEGEKSSLIVSKRANPREEEDGFVKLRARADIRTTIGEADGDYLLLACIKPGEEVPVVRIKMIVAWPEHAYEKDREALTAMIEAVST